MVSRFLRNQRLVYLVGIYITYKSVFHPKRMKSSSLTSFSWVHYLSRPRDSHFRLIVLLIPNYFLSSCTRCLVLLPFKDPIELSDNVAKNVSIKAVKAMRHAMMLSLAAMKQNADSFAVMLGVLKSDSGTASPKLNMPPTGNISH